MPRKRLGEYRSCLQCGEEFYATRVQIKNGIGKYCSRSCTGYNTGNRKHGHNGLKRSSTYTVWAGIIQRCNNPNNKKFAYYGGRGITVCKRWLSYENFLVDVGERPADLTLERKDNLKGYEPDNCYWATRKEQMRNTRWNRLLTFDGRTQCVSAWVEESGLSRQRLITKASRGDSLVEMEEV